MTEREEMEKRKDMQLSSPEEHVKVSLNVAQPRAETLEWSRWRLGWGDPIWENQDRNSGRASTMSIHQPREVPVWLQRSYKEKKFFILGTVWWKLHWFRGNNWGLLMEIPKTIAGRSKCLRMGDMLLLYNPICCRCMEGPWESLQNRKCPQIFQMKHDISVISQGDDFASTYFEKIKSLWD